MQTFYSSGKLLLTAEYVVLDGALALAVPTKYGQSLSIEEIEDPKLVWKSIDEQGDVWFETKFDLQNNVILNQVQDDCKVAKRLLEILQVAKKLNPEFLNNKKGYKITTFLEFPNNWGLGTSSTLIHNIATWANVNAYQLLEKTFGGSGYDIACAKHKTAITYQLLNTNPNVHEVTFNPLFKEHLYFLHLNKKQNSRDGISKYKKTKNNLEETIVEINSITKSIINCKSQDIFNSLIDKHEQIISNIIGLKPVKEVLFKDFKGSIKSLGAWGGDFVLVSSKTNPKAYFKSKGFETILDFDDMIAY